MQLPTITRCCDAAAFVIDRLRHHLSALTIAVSIATTGDVLAQGTALTAATTTTAKPSLHGAQAPAAAPTFHRDIAPLLQRHCEKCHRDEGAGPFALVDYAEVAGVAAMVGEVVAQRRMPPWHADRTVGRFANDPSLPEAALATIAAWIAAGAPEGDRRTAPPPRTWPSSWSLATPPDLVLTTPNFTVPAEGTLPYQYVRLATGLSEHRFVRAAEVRSVHPEVVHHSLVFQSEGRGAREARPAAKEAAIERPWRPGFNQLELMQGAKPHEIPQWNARFMEMIRRDLRYGEAGGLNGYFLSGLAGGGAVEFEPDEGKFLAAGSDLIVQLHYQPIGKVTESSTSIALWFADGPRARALDTRGVATVVFAIPPGAGDHAIHAEYRLPVAATLRSLQPHLHLRGRSFTYLARYPDGREETLLHVPAYDFNWQHEYVLAERKKLPEGTVLRVTAHFDNSAANPANPDPSQTVYFGLQTHEEMLIGYFEVTWHPGE